MGQPPTHSDGSLFPGFADGAPDPSALIDSLAARRREHGLSQTEVAAQMGTSQSAVARLESGQSDVRLSTLIRYADAVATSIHFSLTSREPPSP